MDRDRLAARDRGDEERNDRRVLGERALAGAEDVEVAEHDGLERLVDAGEGDAVALGGELRNPVGRDRVERALLAGRSLTARPVDRGRRGEDDPAHPLVAGGEQDVQRALDVDRARGERVLNRARYRAERAEVEDDLGAADGVVDPLVAAELALDDLDREPVEVRPRAGREVVEHPHLVAGGEQRPHEVRADEAGAAGDEDPHASLSGDDREPEAEPGDCVERDAGDDPDRVPGSRRDEDEAGGGKTEERSRPCSPEREDESGRKGRDREGEPDDARVGGHLDPAVLHAPAVAGRGEGQPRLVRELAVRLGQVGLVVEVRAFEAEPEQRVVLEHLPADPEEHRALGAGLDAGLRRERRARDAEEGEVVRHVRAS